MDDAVGSELWSRVKRGGEGESRIERPTNGGAEGGRRGALRELLLLLFPRYRPLHAAAPLT